MSKKNSKKGLVSARASSTRKKNHSGKTKVLITGISGFIGSELAERLVDQGYEVSGIVRHNFRPSSALDRLKGKVSLHTGNLCDFSGLRRILREASPDVIVHLAAITPVSYSFDHPQEVTEVNYLGTINLAEAARQFLPNLELFTFSSSMEVYGHQPSRPFQEHHTVSPNCPYAVAKHACEKYLQYMWQTYKFPSVALRQTNCYGRRDNDYFVVEAFITQMLQGKTVNFGRPEPVRNFIHIKDLTDLYLSILENHGPKSYGHVYNTGPANGITIKELQQRLATIMGWKGKVNWNTREMRAGEIFYLNSLNTKATNAFDWKPKISLNVGLRSTIDYWRKKSKKK